MKCADIQKSRAAGRIYCVIGLAGLTGILVSALVALPASAGPETPASSNPSDDIRRLREQLAEQTKRIDHLYDALGPELPEMEARAAELKKQRAEDAVLAMKEVFRSKDEAFNSKLMFVPATRRLAVAQADGSVKLLRLPEGEVEATLDGLGDAAQCLAASADGKKIFAGTKKGLLLAWQDGSNNARKVFDWQGWPVTALAVGPDGSRLACACNGKYGSNREWIKPENSLLMIETASGKELWAGKVGRGDFQAVAFAGDGKTVAVVRDGVVALLDAGTGRTLRELAQKDHPSGPLSTALSRDGKWCAVGYAPYNIGLWNADAGKCQRLLQTGEKLGDLLRRLRHREEIAEEQRADEHGEHCRRGARGMEQ